MANNKDGAVENARKDLAQRLKIDAKDVKESSVEDADFPDMALGAPEDDEMSGMMITRYADIHLRDESDAAKRVSRWQRIALEAAKQSGRAFVPEISTPVAFDSVTAEGLGVMFSERSGEALESLIEPARSHITALVGSEGGWSDEEIESARARNFHVITLGGRILRAETAAITVTALLQHMFGDLR